MGLSNATTSRNIINAKDNILHNLLLIVDHSKWPSMFFKHRSWTNRVLAHGSSDFQIEEKMRYHITSCREHNRDCQIISHKSAIKNTLYPKYILDQLILN